MSRRVVNERGWTIGASHHRARLSDSDVERIVALREQGMFFREIAQRFGVGETTVKDICSGRRRAQLAATGPVGPRASGADTEVAKWSFSALQDAWGVPP